MEKINILHIASFSGNIGDNANHNGFRSRLAEIIGKEINYTEIEMREFYKKWDLRKFNSQLFIDICNQHDLVVIGGGNFFELKWDYSCTGTTIDISNDTLDKINTPILFNALGCDIAKGTNKNNIDKFEQFLSNVCNSDKYLVSVRNDGSYTTLDNLYQGKYNEKILRVPDAAFFIKNHSIKNQLIQNSSKNIGINIVADMKDVRFDINKANSISYKDFIENFADSLNMFLKENESYNLILFPHIHSDLRAICDLLEKIEDIYTRTRVVIAPCLIGEGAEEQIFTLYRQCEIILGMRFHSNVCAIAQEIPTIGLSSYKKIDDLYEEIGLSERVIGVNKIGFKEKLNDMFIDTLNNSEKIKKQYKMINKKLHLESEQFYDELKGWCKRNGII